MSKGLVLLTNRQSENILNRCQSMKSLNFIQSLSLCLKKLASFIVRKLRRLSWTEKSKLTICTLSETVNIKPIVADSQFSLKALLSPSSVILMGTRLQSLYLKFLTKKKIKEKSPDTIDKCATSTIVKNITFSDIAKGELVLK